MRPSRVFAAVTTAAGVCAALVSVAFTSPAGATSSDPTAGMTKNQISYVLAQMVDAHASDQQIKARLNLTHVVNKARINPTMQRQINATNSGPVSPDSASNIRLSAPQFYTNPQQESYVDFGWQFNTVAIDGATCTLTCTRSDRNLGGAEQFGVGLSRQVVNLGGALYFKGSTSHYPEVAATNYFQNSASGVAWSFQDKWVSNSSARADDVNVYQGSAVLNFDGKISSCVQAFSKYSHTWDSTKVTAVTIQPPATYAVTFGSAGHQWERASDGGSFGC